MKFDMSKQTKPEVMFLHGGKYTVINDNGKLTARHYGEPMRELIDHELILSMFIEARMLKDRCDKLQKTVELQSVSVPPQKPELRVGQIWRTRCGGVAEIESETQNASYPFCCLVDGEDIITVTKDGRYYNKYLDFPYDFIDLISNVKHDS